MDGRKKLQEIKPMFDIYARTFMTATRNRHIERPCIPVKPATRRGWLGRQTRCINLDKL